MKAVSNISYRFVFIIFRKGLALPLLLICHPFVLASPIKSSQWLIITNTTALERKGEVIAVKRTLFGNIEKNLIPQIKKGSSLLVSQQVDKNSDGEWDELLIEVSVAPLSKDTLLLEWTTAETFFKPVANVRLSLRSDTQTPSPEITKEVRLRGFTQNIARPFYQMEGPGIENDKVAFRAFFDARNGKDIYGKIVDTPVLECIGVGASWHELQPWGMDVFHTGNSLGAGGLAVEEKGAINRLGDADTTTFEVLYKGALSAAFRLHFSGWDVAASKGSGSETLSVTKGKFYYQNEIVLRLAGLQHLVAGIANFGTNKVVYKKHNPAFSSLSIYGPQAEGTGTRLGVAILFPSNKYVKHGTANVASSIPNTSYVTLKPSLTGKTTLCFFACWEKTDSRFSQEQGFYDYLQTTAEALAAPLQVKISNQKPL